LEVRTLYFDPFVVVVPQGAYSFADQKELSALLKASPFIFFNKGFAAYYNEKLVEICERLGFRPDIVHEANNVHSILQLIEAGLGVSILPASLQKQYGHLNVDFIKLKDIPVHTEVVLAYKAGNRNAALNWFIDHYIVTQNDTTELI
jgi:DNA-binding transcriptional LysR family regulator